MGIISDQSPSTISFSLSEETIKGVTIETSRLCIQPVRLENLKDYISLFGDPVAMANYATGQTKDAEHVEKRLQGWVTRWADGDPFSGLAIFDKNSGDFIGHIVLGHGDDPGQSETAILLKPTFWNNGYGREAVSAILEHYAPKLVEMGCMVDGAPFREIVATAKADAVASNRIFSSYMKLAGQEEKYGSLRNKYSKEIQAAPAFLSRIQASTGEVLGEDEPKSA